MLTKVVYQQLLKNVVSRARLTTNRFTSPDHSIACASPQRGFLRNLQFSLKTLSKAMCVIPLALTSSAVFASSNWGSCATKEGKDCNFPWTGTTLFRYGVADKGYYYTLFKNPDPLKVKCDNSGGDPIRENKVCDIMEATMQNTGLTTSDTSYCNKEGKTCTIKPAGVPTWVMYGAINSWVFSVQSDTFTCNNSTIGRDPIKKNKSCYTGRPLFVDDAGKARVPDWTFCATEGQRCYIDAGGEIVLIRYGKNNWTYRVGTFSPNQEFKCETDSFKFDPEKTNKSCYYTKVSPPKGQDSLDVIGKWKRAGTFACSGSVDCTMSRTVDYGTTRSESITDTEEWNTSVTTSVSGSATGGFLGVSSSVEASAGYAQSTSYTEALEESTLTSVSATCTKSAASGSGTLELWQFEFTASGACDSLQGGSCSSTTLPQDYFCGFNTPSGYTGPQCLPGDCDPSDPYCSLCKM